MTYSGLAAMSALPGGIGVSYRSSYSWAEGPTDFSTSQTKERWRVLCAACFEKRLVEQIFQSTLALEKARNEKDTLVDKVLAESEGDILGASSALSRHDPYKGLVRRIGELQETLTTLTEKLATITLSAKSR